MKMRKGAPLLFALATLLSAVPVASASTCGAVSYACCDGCGDAQNCFSVCQQQNRVCYRLVYDNVMEKRWHTCYKTECYTNQVTKTCFREECQTRFRECHVTRYKDVMVECCKQVQRTCWKEIQCTECRPCIEHCVKDVECCVRRCVPKCCEKECCYTVCVPKYEQHCHVHCGQVQKQICEQHCKECCHTVCREVCETRHREVCCQVSKCVEECCMKQVCVPCCHEVQETCWKTCTKRICEPCTTYKTVTRRVVECVEEPCTPLFPGLRGLFNGLGNRSVGCETGCGNNACGNACSDACCRNTCDPCCDRAGRFLDRFRAGFHGGDCCDPCATSNVCCNSCALVPTRKVWKVRNVCEQVACTTNVTRVVCEKVPYTVCKKVVTNEIKNVPYTVRRNVRGAYVDDKGCAFECDGPGRTFKECAVARKLIPYNVSHMVSTVEKTMVPYTTSRCARGAYVDEKGEGFACEGPGRHFQEGSSYKIAKTYTTCCMVQETRVKKVPYTVYETVIEKQIKKVPYQVCRMVPHTVCKKVPYQVCEIEKHMVCKKVPYTECVQQPYTVRCKVPYTVVENVPCTRRVKVCVPEEVCVKRARLVPVTVTCDPGCGNACGNGCCDKGCGTACCDSHSCFLERLKQRWFASLCSTGCCEDHCQTGCNDYCREGLLQRFFRNRFACEPTCGESGCSTGGCGGATMAPVAPSVPAEPVVVPKSLPKN